MQRHSSHARKHTHTARNTHTHTHLPSARAEASPKEKNRNNKLTTSKMPQHYGKWILQGPNELLRTAGAPPVRLRLFCVPQAGCGAWSFHGWTQHLPADVEVMPIELPGRNSRMGESKDATSVAQLASEIVDAVQALLPGGEGGGGEGQNQSNPPYALFGHSMGAWVVYEMAREIRRRRRRGGGGGGGGGGGAYSALAMPRKLYVCGNRAPHLGGPANDPDLTSPSIAELPARDFWKAFERRYGANPDLASPGIRAYILPLLRAVGRCRSNSVDP